MGIGVGFRRGLGSDLEKERGRIWRGRGSDLEGDRGSGLEKELGRIRGDNWVGFGNENWAGFNTCASTAAGRRVTLGRLL